MAMYKALRYYQRSNPEKADFIAGKLLNLRERLAQEITNDRRPNSLIIGSWNIRNFDSGMGGDRLDESYHYIAEIIDRFDVCAIQEVMSDMEPLKRLVRTLGPNWDYFVTDVTSGSRGNNERSAFVYNTNKVRFRNLVGEIVLSEDELVDNRQFARTPFFAAFQAQWFRFILCSTHIIYGGSDKQAEKDRAKEISALAQNLRKRAEKDGEVYILLGDLNVVDEDSPTMKALQDAKLMIPKFGGTNLGGDKDYDQLTFTGEGKKVQLLRHDKFDWRSTVFREDEIDYYEQYNVKEEAGKKVPRYKTWNKRWYKEWMTHQMSDHLPIWVELEIDYSDKYLEQFLAD